MVGKVIFDGSVKTQSVKSVKVLLAWKGSGSDPLPEFVEMGCEAGRLVLVLSNKKDVYYVVTPKACSCPSQTYRGGPCKHMRRYFPQFEKLAAKDEGSIRPTEGWIGPDGQKANGPVEA
jgi:hypothetical protein